MKLFNKLKQSRGFIQILLIVAAAVLVMVVVSVIPVSVTTNTQVATDYLTSRGYVVLAAGEYESISDKLDALKVSADAAVANAEAAVIAAEAAVTAVEEAIDKVDLFNSAEVYLYATTSNITCSFTAGNTNEWSVWTEIVDSGATALSSMFAVNAGYITDIHCFLPSDANDGYNIELSYGATKNNLGRTTFYAPADSIIPYILPIKTRAVPAGETIYYRMQSTGANGATVQVRLRYFYE